MQIPPIKFNGIYRFNFNPPLQDAQDLYDKKFNGKDWNFENPAESYLTNYPSRMSDAWYEARGHTSGTISSMDLVYNNQYFRIDDLRGSRDLEELEKLYDEFENSIGLTTEQTDKLNQLAETGMAVCDVAIEVLGEDRATEIFEAVQQLETNFIQQKIDAGQVIELDVIG